MKFSPALIKKLLQVLGNPLGYELINQIQDNPGDIVIADATVITNITADANWDGDGEYTGPTTGLVNGNVHYDSNLNLYYKYNGSTLLRFEYNTKI